jgi:hypothetical protein
MIVRRACAASACRTQGVATVAPLQCDFTKWAELAFWAASPPIYILWYIYCWLTIDIKLNLIILITRPCENPSYEK